MTHELIEGRAQALGSLPIRRILPFRHRRAVGPFVFLDEMGPVEFGPGEGIDVPPHPHIGLSTLTYMLEGGLMHRDSLGSDLEVLPGAVNWMTAGHGVTHSERSSAASRATRRVVHGLQIWVAHPPGKTEVEPFFEHHARETLPGFDEAGMAVRVVAGSAFGRTAPVTTLSELFFLDARWVDAGATLGLPEELGQRAVYPLSGAIEVDGTRVDPGSLLVIAEGADGRCRAEPGTRGVMFGGPMLDSEPLMHWNYVAYDQPAIDAAKRRWADGGFPPVPHDPGTS